MRRHGCIHCLLLITSNSTKRGNILCDKLRRSCSPLTFSYPILFDRSISGGQSLCVASCWCYLPPGGSDRQGGGVSCHSSWTRHRWYINRCFGNDLLECRHLAASCGYDIIQKPNRTGSRFLFGDSTTNIHEQIWRWCQHGLVCSIGLDDENTELRL